MDDDFEAMWAGDFFVTDLLANGEISQSEELDVGIIGVIALHVSSSATQSFGMCKKGPMIDAEGEKIARRFPRLARCRLGRYPRPTGSAFSVPSPSPPLPAGNKWVASAATDANTSCLQHPSRV
jgi:hypothetical protein